MHTTRLSDRGNTLQAAQSHHTAGAHRGLSVACQRRLTNAFAFGLAQLNRHGLSITRRLYYSDNRDKRNLRAGAYEQAYSDTAYQYRRIRIRRPNSGLFEIRQYSGTSHYLLVLSTYYSTRAGPQYGGNS